MNEERACCANCGAEIYFRGEHSFEGMWAHVQAGHVACELSNGMLDEEHVAEPEAVS